MLALQVEKKSLRLKQIEKPDRTDEALVRVLLSGICNTDLEIVKGYMGFRGTLGHELVGVVAEGPSAWLGKRVVSEINFACGGCEYCARDLGRHCPLRTVMGIVGQDGAFAESVAVPIVNLHAVPDGVSDDEAVFTEPLAAAFEIREQVRIDANTEATVLGDGKLGLLVAQVLALAGARVLLVGKHDERLAIVRARNVETITFDAWDRTPRDVTVEATGTSAGLPLALAATRPRGTLVLKSTVADREPIDMAPFVIHEISLVGSRCGPFAPALAALADQRVDVRSLIAARFPLA
ncbi:MAG TPA: alcohol dehydrogenase catalytic domain-containing protein, partial [Pyrinomonadaceae bacterium]|nr:alcohol dehydrogenase catalytic domain-containing protein [Pyrinomonadaceae bacterium]